MANVDPDDKALLVKVRELLQRKPGINDANFCVGPKKKVVKALKVLLIASSPVFEAEFEQRWDADMVAKDEEGIPLPDFDAQAFELFVKLTQLDTWSTGVVEKLNLLPDQLLNLMSICRHFKITNALQSLEKLLKTYLRSLRTEVESDGFLQLSQSNLETILTSDEIPMKEIDLFLNVCRWAEFQCKIKNLGPSAKNFRIVLGECLFRIRFPLMSNTEFTRAVEHKRILTNDEGFDIYRFIGLQRTKKKYFDAASLPFSIVARDPPFEILDLTKGFKIVDNSAIISDEAGRAFSFETKQRITLHGLGFLGPLDEDAFYCVFIRISESFIDLLASGSKNIFARKGKMFYFILDEPITLEARPLDGEKMTRIYHSLKGPKRQAMERSGSTISKQQVQESEFQMKWKEGSESCQIAQIMFTKAV